MSDATNHSLPSSDPDEEQFQALRRELLNLPKVAAPDDFLFRLKQTIAARQLTPDLPWWKKLFVPASKGGLRIPAYAYGAMAVVIVLVISLYVYKRANIEEQYRGLETLEEGTREPGVRSTGESPETNDIGPGSEMSGPGQAGPSNETPVVAPGTTTRTESLKREEAVSAPATSTEKADKPDAGTAPEEKRKRAVEFRAKSSEPLRSGEKMPPSALPQVKTQPDLQESDTPTIRGFVLDEKEVSSVADSVRADSLRRLDSLRRIR